MKTITEAMLKLNESENEYQDMLDEIGNDPYWNETKNKLQEIVNQLRDIRTGLKTKLKEVETDKGIKPLDYAYSDLSKAVSGINGVISSLNNTVLYNKK